MTSVIKGKWKNPENEIVVYYDPYQRKLYEENNPEGIYYKVRWPDNLRVGRLRNRTFPEIVAREHFRNLGYQVLLSDLPNNEGFILLHFAGKRRQRDPAYVRMRELFPDKDLDKLNEIADEAKRKETGNIGGGDPDLFVYKTDRSGQKFFVEVKDEDQLHQNQLVCFPIIEDYLDCEVRIARIQVRERSY